MYRVSNWATPWLYVTSGQLQTWADDFGTVRIRGVGIDSSANQTGMVVQFYINHDGVTSPLINNTNLTYPGWNSYSYAMEEETEEIIQSTELQVQFRILQVNGSQTNIDNVWIEFDVIPE